MSSKDDLEGEIRFLRGLGGRNRYFDIWKGAMVCGNCMYNWQSRRTSPPASCPKCGSKDVKESRERLYY